MKTLKTIIFASAALLAAAACTKEANPKEESVPSAPGTIEVNVTALIGDLAPSEGTKATMDPVIRLTWADEGDVVYAYDATQKIGNLTVTPASDGLSAKLSGTLSEVAAGTTIITLVYCNTATEAPEITNGNITFDLSTQNEAANPFVVYATLDYTAGQTSITDKIVPFNFATSLMRVTVTGLANADIDQTTISGVNTKCELTVNADAAPAVAGTTPGTITRAAAGITKSDDGRAVFNVSVAAEATTNDSRTLSIEQGTLKYGSKLMSQAIAAGQSIISVYALTEQTGSRGKINGHDYVYVAGKKWATQNLAITTSGNKEWKPSGSTVKVPCSLSEENVVVGDYFQWGAYPGYVTVNGDDKGLLIYISFTNTQCGDTEDEFNFKMNKDFGINNIYPYKGDTRYNESDRAYRPNLDIGDDVAHTLWGDTWRMPTSQEFIELCAACFVEWDGTNKGWLFYAPKSDADKGLLKLSESSWQKIKITETDTSYKKASKPDAFEEYTATAALLFFPAAGSGINDKLLYYDMYGVYWSSTLIYSDQDPDYPLLAYILEFNQNGVSLPQGPGGGMRSAGFSVRPLSD